MRLVDNKAVADMLAAVHALNRYGIVKEMQVDLDLFRFLGGTKDDDGSFAFATARGPLVIRCLAAWPPGLA